MELKLKKNKNALEEKQLTKSRKWLKRNGISLALAFVMAGSMAGLSTLDVNAINVLKQSNSKITGLDNIPNMAATIVQVIGAVVAIFGGAQLGLGFAQDNPDGQSRGLKFFIGGAIAFGTTTLLKWISFSS